MKLDQVSRDLMAGAKFINQHGFPPDDPHPLRAVARTLQRLPQGEFGYGPTPWKTVACIERFHLAADRLYAACGLDNMDLSPEEAIDSLVAAAFWEIP